MYNFVTKNKINKNDSKAVVPSVDLWNFKSGRKGKKWKMYKMLNKTERLLFPNHLKSISVAIKDWLLFHVC